jgi:hypothetical protein
MGTLIRAGGSLGCQAVVASDGDVYALVQATDTLYIMKSTGGAFSQAGAAIENDIFGATSGSFDIFSCAIDSGDDIHIVCAYSTNAATRDISYRVFDTATDSWVGSWELVDSYNQSPGSNTSFVDIDIDSSDYPHVMWTDWIKSKGIAYSQLKYTERTGGSWSTAELVSAQADANYLYPNFSINGSDQLMAFYYNQTDGDPCYRQRTTGWGSETAYTETNAFFSTYSTHIVTTSGDVNYVVHATAAYDLQENNQTNSLTINSTYPHAAITLDGGVDKRYWWYIDTNADIRLAWATGTAGTGYTDVGVIEAGSFEGVNSVFQYNNHNLVDEVACCYFDGSNWYYTSYVTVVPTRRVFVTHV